MGVVGAWVALTALSAAACDKVPLLAPTSSTIVLFVSNSVVPVNGSTELVANVLEASGTPVHNGTLVTFTTNLGAIEPREARTSGGKVTARLMAGTQSGTAKVGAISGGAKATELDVKIGGAAATRVILNVSPGTVPARGGRVDLVAGVLDVDGNRLPGVPVVFTSTTGTLGASTVVTDQDGEARTALTTNREATVTASAGNQRESVTVRVNAPPNITINTTTATPTEGQPTVFNVTVTPSPNGTAVQSARVDFGDGQSQSLGALTGSTSVPHIYARASTYTATATVTDVNDDTTSQSTVVVVSISPAPGVTISTTTANPTEGQPVVFLVTVTQATNGTAIQSARIDFGDGQSQPLGALTGGTSVAHTYQRANTYTVTATATDVNGGSRSVVTVIVVAQSPPLNVNVTASSASPPVRQPVTFTATVTSPTGTPVVRSYEWSFGDGGRASTTGNQVTHIYLETGRRVIQVVVFADQNNGNGYTEINVVAATPVAGADRGAK